MIHSTAIRRKQISVDDCDSLIKFYEYITAEAISCQGLWKW